MPINIYDFGCIYKIYCKDRSIPDIYIGSTIAIATRMKTHKYKSIKEKTMLYNFINDKGGFDNFDFDIVETYKS